MNILFLGCLAFSMGHLCAAEEEKNEVKSESKEPGKDLLDFSSIKDIIKKDGLEGELKKKQEEKSKKKKDNNDSGNSTTR